jgi:NAD(P)-dependent dehydrogenase (short-subunit alcohol dehydrogenase family)
MARDLDFTDRVVLVTGGSRGIGREAARQFAERGARVIVHYRGNEAAARATLESLAGEGHAIESADLADASSVRALAARVLEQYGRIDVLVNNAGIWVEHPPATTDWEQWRAAWDETLGTNLLGPAWLIHAVVPAMIAAGGGRIVNVSSRGAFRGEPEGPAYAASKAGLNAMGQSLAKALGPHGIYVTTVAPGFVETDMARDFLAGPQGDFLRGESPLGRVARPEEVARTILFLASDGAEFLTGGIVDVNGASYLRS